MIQDSYCFQSQAEVPVVPSIDKETPHTLASPAYELKFLIDENRSGEVLAWARTISWLLIPMWSRLSATPIGSPASTSTLKRWMPFATAVLRPDPNSGYAVTVTNPQSYLERKRKKRDCVEKRRVPVLERR